MCDAPTLRHSVSCVSLVPVKGGGDCHHQLFPQQSPPVRTLCVLGWLSFLSTFPSFVLSFLECATTPRWSYAVLQWCILGCHLRTHHSPFGQVFCVTRVVSSAFCHTAFLYTGMSAPICLIFRLSLQNQSGGNRLVIASFSPESHYLFYYYSHVISFTVDFIQFHQGYMLWPPPLPS